MNSCEVIELDPPHSKPSSIINRYLERLMQLTYDNPVLVRNLIKAAGASSLALTALPLAASALGYDISAGAAVSAAVAGVGGAALSGFSWFMQNRFYGLPVEKNNTNISVPAPFQYSSARGEYTADKNCMPRLKIVSGNHYDAGYVEGYMLAEGIRENLASTNFLYKSMWMMGAPWLKSNISRYLHQVLKTIPENYLAEMNGKIAGYNQWLHNNNIYNEDLELNYYLLLQLLPDIRNYNPFSTELSAPSLPDISPACTTIALRVGDYTFFTRVLDWPAYNVAGKSFLQIDRNIQGTKRTIDIGFPLLSGALTVLNNDGMLIEMNVAHGNKVMKPEGMPAVFFNRFCAEHAANITELDALIAANKPLAAYHLTACDGNQTKSFHFYQNPNVQGEHSIDELDTDQSSSRLLVVANHGLHFDESGSDVVNHRDSDERKQNIHQLFSQRSVQDKFKTYIDKQKGGQSLSTEDVVDLKEFCLQVARLPLICNCSSVLCALYVYHHDKLIDASAATDNLYAQRSELSEFASVVNPVKAAP